MSTGSSPEIPGTAKFRSGWVVSRTTQLAFPRTVIDNLVVRKADALLADDSVDNGVRRGVSDEADDIRRALHIRRRFNIP
jgi:aminopeptidase N